MDWCIGCVVKTNLQCLVSKEIIQVISDELKYIGKVNAVCSFQIAVSIHYSEFNHIIGL